MFSSDAARRAPGSSPADLRKATKAMGIGSLAMSPQNSGKLAGKHHCSLPTACTKFDSDSFPCLFLIEFAWIAPVMLTATIT